MIFNRRNKLSKSWNSTISRYDHFESDNYFKSNKPMPGTTRKMESLFTLFITGRWLKIAIFQEKLFFRRRQFSAETETETFRWQENCSNYFVPKKVSSSTKHGFDLERGDNDNVGDATMAKMMKAKATTTILATTAPIGAATTAFWCCRLLQIFIDVKL